jgi:nickel-type superoxide dismutase maturation protease
MVGVPDGWWPWKRVRVAEHSMLPTLRHGDWLIARRTRRVRPGQVVLAWHPRRPALLLVKRATRRAGAGWWLESDFPEAPGAVDSSGFGPVPDELIVGRVIARYWPKFKCKFLYVPQRSPRSRRVSMT